MFKYFTARAIISLLLYLMSTQALISSAFDKAMIMILVFPLIIAIAAKKDFHENFKLRLLAPFLYNRVFLSFSMIVDLFGK